MSIRTTSGWGWTVSQEFAPDYIVPVGNSEVVFMVLAQDPPDNLQPPYKVNVMMVPSKTEQGLPFYLLLAAIYSLMIRRLKDLKTLKDFKMLKYLMLYFPIPLVNSFQIWPAITGDSRGSAPQKR